MATPAKATREIPDFLRMSGELKFGMVGSDEGIITTEVAPFGGLKELGVGKEGSKYGIEDYFAMIYLCLGGLA